LYRIPCARVAAAQAQAAEVRLAGEAQANATQLNGAAQASAIREKGLAEAQPGYGHATAEEVADAVLEWMEQG